MNGQGTRRVAIVGGIRIPFCRAYTAYARASNQDMMTAVLQGARRNGTGSKARSSATSSLGAVIKHSRDFNLARESTLSSGLAPETPAFDLQRACGTSLSATILIGGQDRDRTHRRRHRGRHRQHQRHAGRLSGRVPRLLLAECARPHARRSVSSRGSSCVRDTSSPCCPDVVEPRTRSLDGREHGDHGEAVADLARGARRARAREPSERRESVRGGLLRRPARRVPRREARQQHARRHEPRASSRS